MTIINKVSAKSVMPGVTAIPDVVDAPTIGTATGTSDGTLTATVAFTPVATGGAATSYGAVSTPGSLTGTAASSPITVSGLTDSTSYTFKVYGINSSGTWSSVLSSSSNSITSTDPSATYLIQRIAGTGSSGTITFSSIPQTYKHLQIRFLAKSTTTTSINESVLLRLNGDSATNYVEHYLFGSGTTVTANSAITRSSVSIYNGAMRSNATYANMMGVGIIDIHDYASTTNNKTVRYFCGNDVNASASVGPALGSGLWLNTAAVSSVSLVTSSGNWDTTTSIALYGIKG